MRTTIKKAINRRIRKIVASRFSIEQHEARLLNRKSGFVSRRTSNESIHYLLKELYPVHGEGMELVRLGPKGDGGYLVPNDFEGIEACFSPGVSQVSGFEKDCANLGMKIFMADKSVNKPAEQHELFSFTKKYIGSFGNEDFITMDDWGNGSITNRHSNLLLQMDIESAEYESLLNMSDQLLNRFRLIVIEFHQLDQFGNLPFFNITSNAFRKILKSHRCVHIHPNIFMQRLGKETLKSHLLQNLLSCVRTE